MKRSRELLMMVFQDHAASLADMFALGLQALQNSEIVGDLFVAETVCIRGARSLLFGCTNEDEASRKNHRCTALSKNRHRTPRQEQCNNTEYTT
jgi:hypothetical protein